MAVEEKVKQIIVEQLQVDEAEVTPGASFRRTWAPIRSTWWSW
jgi:acyl carrier protein